MVSHFGIPLAAAFQFCADIAPPPSLPNPCTLRHLLTHYLDICGVPKRSFFELLSHFTSSDLEKEKLKEFCSPQGQV